MKKIIVIIFLMVCSLFIASCDVNSNNNQNQDPSLDGIDISKVKCSIDALSVVVKVIWYPFEIICDANWLKWLKKK